MAFHFRQFQVEDTHSTLRVGTDAMLLGAWATPGPAGKILDIGTGCGVLALMMAQKSVAQIHAIDIDKPSIREARSNFALSPWSERLYAIHQPLAEFALHSVAEYDFIISNPPYFANSLKSPSNRKNMAKHDKGFSLTELVTNVKRLLCPGGRFSLILPAGQAIYCIMLFKTNGLFLHSRLTVFPKPASFAKRMLMQFSTLAVGTTSESELTILDESGNYSVAYLALTNSFHKF